MNDTIDTNNAFKQWMYVFIFTQITFIVGSVICQIPLIHRLVNKYTLLKNLCCSQYWYGKLFEEYWCCCGCECRPCENCCYWTTVDNTYCFQCNNPCHGADSPKKYEGIKKEPIYETKKYNTIIKNPIYKKRMVKKKVTDKKYIGSERKLVTKTRDKTVPYEATETYYVTEREPHTVYWTEVTYHGSKKNQPCYAQKQRTDYKNKQVQKTRQITKYKTEKETYKQYEDVPQYEYIDRMVDEEEDYISGYKDIVEEVSETKIIGNNKKTVIYDCYKCECAECFTGNSQNIRYLISYVILNIIHNSLLVTGLVFSNILASFNPQAIITTSIALTVVNIIINIILFLFNVCWMIYLFATSATNCISCCQS